MENSDDNTPAGILKFSVHRKIINMSKAFLSIIEDLEDEGYKFSDEKYNKIRKKIFDLSGDSYRELESNIDKFEVNLKNNK